MVIANPKRTLGLKERINMPISTVLYFLISAALFAFMMRFGCGAHVMGHAHRRTEATGDAKEVHGNHGIDNLPQQTVDPVCGMTVKISGAESTFYQSRAYYFCSTACREKFQASPDQYVSVKPLGSSHEEHHHGSCC